MNINLTFWPFARIFKGIIAIAFIVMAVESANWFLLFPALLFGIQTIYNAGCGCYAQSCEVKTPVEPDASKEI